MKYGISDTIEKNGIKVTLKEVKKNCFDVQACVLQSYVKSDAENNFGSTRIWGAEEWYDIRKYIYTGASDENLRKQVFNELNQKYGSRLPYYRQYQYFDYTWENVPIKLRENRKAFLSLPSRDYVSNEEYNMNEGYVKGLFYLEPEERNEKIKLIITFEGCGENKEEIEAIETQGICPYTFVFNINLSQIN